MPQYSKPNLGDIITNASQGALDLIEKMLRYNPQKRPNAEELLKEPYFKDLVGIYAKKSAMMKSNTEKTKPKTNSNQK